MLMQPPQLQLGSFIQPHMVWALMFSWLMFQRSSWSCTIIPPHHMLVKVVRENVCVKMINHWRLLLIANASLKSNQKKLLGSQLELELLWTGYGHTHQNNRHYRFQWSRVHFMAYDIYRTTTVQERMHRTISKGNWKLKCKRHNGKFCSLTPTYLNNVPSLGDVLIVTFTTLDSMINFLQE